VVFEGLSMNDMHGYPIRRHDEMIWVRRGGAVVPVVVTSITRPDSYEDRASIRGVKGPLASRPTYVRGTVLRRPTDEEQRLFWQDYSEDWVRRSAYQRRIQD
jgi:hypothetical protein